MKDGYLEVKQHAMLKDAFDAEKIGDVKSLGILKSDISKLYASPELTQALDKQEKV